MRSVGFDSLVPSGGSMKPTIHAPGTSRPRLPRNTDFFAFLAGCLHHEANTCANVFLPGVAGGPRRRIFLQSRPALAAGRAVGPRWRDSASEASMTPPVVSHDSNARAGQARGAPPPRLIAA